MNARAFFPLGKRYKLLRRPADLIMPSSPRPVRRDCHGRLITALIERAGSDSEMVETRLVPWASATFVGARHELVLELRGEYAGQRAEALAQLLPEAEFTLPGHLVADLSVDGCTSDQPDLAQLHLSVLTIESW